MSGNNMSTSYVFIVIVIKICICDWLLWLPLVRGHGRLIDPPGRGTMWRLGFNTPHNYNDHELFCGGYARQWLKNKGRCGVCGDPWDLPRPRPNESGGIFGTGLIARVYREGEEITVTIHLTANHFGWFEFRLCPNNDFNTYVTQKCLNKQVLDMVDYSGTRYEVKQEATGLFRIKVKLPEGVTCTNCVFQWHYTTGNNWGFCQDGKNKAGCGPQEVFRGCSDVAIFSLNDTNYYKFENLTRYIDYEKYIVLDGKTGHYNSDSEENDNKNSSEDTDKDKEKVFNVVSYHYQNVISDSKYNSDRNSINDITSLGKRYNEIRRNNFDSPDEDTESDNESDKNDRRKSDNDKDFDTFFNPNPNYFSDEIQSGNFVFSKIYQKNQNGSLSELKFGQSSESSNKQRSEFSKNELSNSIFNENSEKIDKLSISELLAKSSEQNILRNRFRNNDKSTNTDDTTSKLSRVLSLILTFVSSSSPSEANQFLDTVANVLSVALLKKSKNDDKRREKLTRDEDKMRQTSRASTEEHGNRSSTGYNLN